MPNTRKVMYRYYRVRRVDKQTPLPTKSLKNIKIMKSCSRKKRTKRPYRNINYRIIRSNSIKEKNL